MVWKHVREFIADTSGAALVYVGLVMFAITGFAGLAIDVGHWYATQRAAQTAADSAAVAGAYEAMWGGDPSAVASAATAQAGENGFAASTVTVHNPPVNGADVGNPAAVEVIIQQPTAGLLSALILDDDAVNIAARSVSAPVAGSPACMVALDPAISGAISVSGGASVVANGCMVHVNSSASDAISVSGGGSLTAEAVTVVGDVDNPGAISPSAETGVAPLADPLGYMSPPAIAAAACDHNNFRVKKNDPPLDPGVYCGGIRINAQADAVFNPGIYVIKDGELKMNGNSNVTGDGVAFYLTGPGAHVDFMGGADVHLSAPISGEMAGILFFQGEGVTAGDVNKMTGGGDGWYEGILYFPDQVVKLSGNASLIVAPHSTYIAQSFDVSGSGNLTLNADYASSSVPASPALGAQSIAILE